MKRRIVALVLFLLAPAVALTWLFFLLERAHEEAPWIHVKAPAILIAAASGCVVLALALASALSRLRAHVGFVRLSRELPGFTLVRGPFGIALLARGTVDGVPVTISRSGIDLDTHASRALVLGKRELRAIARGETDEPLVGELARNPALREAAGRLLALSAHVHVEAKRTTIRGVNPRAAESAVRAAIALVRGGALVRGATAGSTCPYCKDRLQPRESEGVIRCPSCDSLHHTDCWREHGGCSVHGCLRVPGEVPSRSRVARPD